MTREELQTKAYEIGIQEANKQRCIVAPFQSKNLMKLIGENNGKAQIIMIAFNNGVACEINRQTRLEF